MYFSIHGNDASFLFGGQSGRIPVLMALSSVAVGILGAIVTGSISSTLDNLDVELTGLTLMIIEWRWVLPLFAGPPFLLSILMLFTSRFRWPLVIASTFLLLIPVAAVLHVFMMLMSALYETQPIG